MENEEDDSGDDEESVREEDEEDENESEERRVQFDMPSETQPWKSNGVISDDDIPSESEDGSEASERGTNITSNRYTPSTQPSKNVEPEDVSSTLKKKREEDFEKGQAVKRQVVCFFGSHDSVCVG